MLRTTVTVIWLLWHHHVTFEALKAVEMKITVLRNVMPCSLVDIYWRFGRKFCLHNLTIKWGSTFLRSTLNIYQIKRRHNPEYDSLPLITKWRTLPLVLRWEVSPVTTISCLMAGSLWPPLTQVRSYETVQITCSSIPWQTYIRFTIISPVCKQK